eukprot:8718377-Heterocapsa_arctica.AAC.1
MEARLPVAFTEDHVHADDVVEAFMLSRRCHWYPTDDHAFSTLMTPFLHIPAEVDCLCWKFRRS